MGVVEQWKEACLEVNSVGRYDEKAGAKSEQVLYEFPDGWSGMFGDERVRGGEVWFDPKNYFDQVRFIFHLLAVGYLLPDY